MISPEALHAILDGYARTFPDEFSAVAALRNGIEAADGDPTYRKTLPGHFTTSALVINKLVTKTLLIDHVLLQVRIQPGGHLEPDDESCRSSAAREAEEETGITGLVPAFPQFGEIPFYITHHQIPANPRKQESPHVHFDLRYAFYADDTIPLLHEAGPIEAAHWVPLQSMQESDTSVSESVKKFLLLRENMQSIDL